MNLHFVFEQRAEFVRSQCNDNNIVIAFRDTKSYIYNVRTRLYNISVSLTWCSISENFNSDSIMYLLIRKTQTFAFSKNQIAFLQIVTAKLAVDDTYVKGCRRRDDIRLFYFFTNFRQALDNVQHIEI